MIRRLLCKILGHKWENHSHITPDSGIEDIGCSRCGEGHRIVWY